MAQDIWSSINPNTTSGLMLVGILADFKEALVSGFSGTSRPSQLQAGGYWVDTTNQGSPNYYYSFKLYDGSTDYEIFRISILNGIGGTLVADSTFTIQEIAADAVGPILDLVKNRIANNGQVLTSDTVAEIRMTGRTDTSTDPVVAYMKFTATDDMLTAASGGTLSFYSTPDATSAIAEHLKFIGGIIETPVAHKLNSRVFGTQNIATSADITALNSDKRLAEMTGSTTTNIHGIDATDDSKIITIHNRSTAYVNLKHQSTTASAANRIKLPENFDTTILPEGSATLFYCTTDSLWKLLAVSSRNMTRNAEEFSGVFNQWLCPSGVTKVRVTGLRNRQYRRNKYLGFLSQTTIDRYGDLYSWGINTNGQLGVGNVTPRSSPVAVLGGLTFKLLAGPGFGVAENGSAYSWGVNTNGQLGVGDVTPRSSPVAVLGGFKFYEVVETATSRYGLTANGKMYAWGLNDFGQLGVGDVTPRSSPVAVLGGLDFARIFISSSGVSKNVYAMTNAGALYAWGSNLEGSLGLGDVTPRSSPVAVLGGIVFKDIMVGGTSDGATGQGTVIGLSSAGLAYAWGFNSNGQLGVGNVTVRSSPVAVLGGLTFTDISLSEPSTSAYALTSTGDAYAWGFNDNGQLGVGDVTPRSSPVAVLGGFKFTQIVGGADSLFAIRKDTGAIYSWGDNPNGQLGLGDVTPRSSPVAVLGGLQAESILVLDTTSVYGITAQENLYAWGLNANGQLGLGDVTPRSSPVAVLGGFGSEVFMPPSTENTFDVVSGTTYDIVLLSGMCSFGSNIIGVNLGKILIGYDS